VFDKKKNIKQREKIGAKILEKIIIIAYIPSKSAGEKVFHRLVKKPFNTFSQFFIKKVL